MVTWSEFQAEALELAAKGEELFDRTGLVLVGTLRRDGWPRISPVEPVIVDGQLELGMMWRSTKALDLRRDRRVLVHSTVSDRNGGDGEFKVYGNATEIHESAARDSYGAALYEKIGWRPEGDEWHLFSVDVAQVAYVRFGEGKQLIQTWRPGVPLAPPVERST